MGCKPHFWEGIFPCSGVYSEGLNVLERSYLPQVGAKYGFSFHKGWWRQC